MKILLINPPFYRFIGLEQDYAPLSLLAVGVQLKKEGYTVFIKNLEVDCDLSYQGYHNRSERYKKYLDALNDNNHYVWKKLREIIQEIKPNKIGITVLNVKYKSALKIIEIAKEFNIKCFVGGMHPSVYPNSYPDSVDVIQGEFESCGSSEILDLDVLPYTDYSMLLDNYGSEGYGHIVTSRGCPYRCRFCSASMIWCNKVRYKSFKRVIEEMRYIERSFNPDCFTIWDETFVITKKRLSDFCKNYDLSTNWRCDTRADTIDDERIKMMKDANCIQVSMGIESGSNKVLKYINKGETIEDYERAAEALNKNGVQWKAYCIIGFPIETKEDILETIKFTKSLKPFRITLSFFTPYKGTSLYDECKELGLVYDNDDLSMYSHQSPHNYFCPKIPKSEFFELRDRITIEVDEYNKKSIKIWR